MAAVTHLALLGLKVQETAFWGYKESVSSLFFLAQHIKIVYNDRERQCRMETLPKKIRTRRRNTWKKFLLEKRQKGKKPAYIH